MNYKVIFPTVGLVTAIIIGVIFISIQEPDNSIQKENLEKQAIEIIQSYQGTDGQGENMLDVFRTAFDRVYPDMDTTVHPDSKISWRAFEDPPFSNTYQVQFEIKTIQEDSFYIWHVNLDSEKIWSNQEAGRGMLRILTSTSNTTSLFFLFF